MTLAAPTWCVVGAQVCVDTHTSTLQQLPELLGLKPSAAAAAGIRRQQQEQQRMQKCEISYI